MSAQNPPSVRRAVRHMSRRSDTWTVVLDHEAEDEFTLIELLDLGRALREAGAPGDAVVHLVAVDHRLRLSATYDVSETS